MSASPWPFSAWISAPLPPSTGAPPSLPSGSGPTERPARINPQFLRVAFAYEALPYEVLQRFRSALAGEHNIAQALETAREVVKVLPAEDLAFVLARLLVCTSDAVD